MRNLFWFRNDLRLHDNAALNAAVANSTSVVPVYILDQRLLEKDRWGFIRLGIFRLKFLMESLEDLKSHLEEKGATLIFKVGIPEQIIPSIAQQYDCEGVYASKEYAHEEEKMEALIGERLPLSLFHTTTLYDPEQLPFSIDQLPKVFTAFRKRVEKYAKVPYVVNAPEEITTPDLEDSNLPSLEDLGFTPKEEDQRAVISFKGGAIEAFKRLDYYLWNKELLSTYKETRNGMIGGDYSSKFSPWLANGSISARTIYHEVEAYEDDVKKNSSTYWMKFELLWREYFKFVAMQYGRKIFFPGGIQDKVVHWKNNEHNFDKWKLGKTGDRFVDANMRELLHTGFMSNRGRQNVASYLVHQLKEDWRKGAAWFESLLVDYDVTSNYGNWMYAAGVGNDPRDRVFNTTRQAKMYDEAGHYRSLWLDKTD
jgi:deoxyribodipyrimidine photo-lyase